jgi:hypothetical protein
MRATPERERKELKRWPSHKRKAEEKEKKRKETRPKEKRKGREKEKPLARERERERESFNAFPSLNRHRLTHRPPPFPTATSVYETTREM